MQCPRWTQQGVQKPRQSVSRRDPSRLYPETLLRMIRSYPRAFGGTYEGPQQDGRWFGSPTGFAHRTSYSLRRFGSCRLESVPSPRANVVELVFARLLLPLIGVSPIQY